MEAEKNYTEMVQLMKDIRDLSGCIEGAKKIKRGGRFDDSHLIFINGAKEYGDIINLKGIAKQVGDERLDCLVRDFAERVEFELLKKMDALKTDIDKYEVVKRE